MLYKRSDFKMNKFIKMLTKRQKPKTIEAADFLKELEKNCDFLDALQQQQMNKGGFLNDNN